MNFKLIIFLGALVLISNRTKSQPVPNLFLVRGFAISAPKPTDLNRFIKFIHEEMATRDINTLILRVDFNFQYESYPNLRDSAALSKSDVNRLVDACKQHHIRIIPQINLLGHQSWHSKVNNLLKMFPEYDETPWVQMPVSYVWPNADGLYCKSYCPLHPDVHKTVFALVDELCDAFQTDAFHAGMDEVFYIGDDRCPRCAGIDMANLFAGEVSTLRDHLTLKGRELWIWGDRLIDGKTTGLGMWEASMNNTYRAVDMISKDVVICDWHYERPDQTAVYFAMKGFRVVTCPWNQSTVAVEQAEDMARFRGHSPDAMKSRFYGMVQTVWSNTEDFLDGFYGIKPKEQPVGQGKENTAWNTFRALYKRMRELEKEK